MTNIMVEDFPVTLWRRFRIIALEQNVPMKKLLARVVSDYLKTAKAGK